MRSLNRAHTFGCMRCDLCQRNSEPDERGWITMFPIRREGRKPLVFTYCPRCVEYALNANAFIPRDKQDP